MIIDARRCRQLKLCDVSKHTYKYTKTLYLLKPTPTIFNVLFAVTCDVTIPRRNLFSVVRSSLFGCFHVIAVQPRPSLTLSPKPRLDLYMYMSCKLRTFQVQISIQVEKCAGVFLGLRFSKDIFLVSHRRGRELAVSLNSTISCLPLVQLVASSSLVASAQECVPIHADTSNGIFFLRCLPDVNLASFAFSLRFCMLVVRA